MSTVNRTFEPLHCYSTAYTIKLRIFHRYRYVRRAGAEVSLRGGDYAQFPGNQPGNRTKTYNINKVSGTPY